MAGRQVPSSVDWIRSLNRFGLGLFIHPLKRSSKPQSTLVAQTFLAKVRNGPPICFRIRCCDLLRPPRCTGAFIEKALTDGMFTVLFRLRPHRQAEIIQ
jgi:hypothetical protein